MSALVPRDTHISLPTPLLHRFGLQPAGATWFRAVSNDA